MNWKTWAPLAVAVVLGLAAAMVARNMLAAKPAAQAGPKSVQVVVAKVGLTPGQPLTAMDLGTTAFPGETVPAGMFADPIAVTGRVLSVPIGPGQPVVDAMLAPRDTGSGLQALIPTGMRAVTVDVTETSGVAGLLGPGCLVDMVTTFQGGPTGPETRTVVQGIKIQAVGQRMGPPVEGQPVEMFKTVTLLVTPQQAETIELSNSVSRPRLVLRNTKDDADAQTPGVTLAEIRDGPGGGVDPFAIAAAMVKATTQPLAVARPEPVMPSPVRRVTVIRGGVESDVTFELRRPNRSTGGMFTGAEVEPVMPNH